MKDYAIGIDLGSTHSCVGVYKDGKVNIITNDNGERTTPSWVSKRSNGEIIVGSLAKSGHIRNYENTYYNTKRYIGRSKDDKVLKDHNRDVTYDVHEVDPVEIATEILKYLKKTAEDYLGDKEKVTKCVVTIPAYFNDAQRSATKEACELANMEVLRMVNEPTSASIAYGLESKIENKSNILVYDLGGSTFDITLLSIDDGIYEVIGTLGDSKLGGEDFDQNMMNNVLSKIQTSPKYRSKNITQKGYAKLKSECERVKKVLSTNVCCQMSIEAIFSDGSDYQESFNQAQFNSINSHLFNRTIEFITKLMEDVRITSKNQVSEVVLVGGSTRIPRIKELLKQYFQYKVHINDTIDPDLSVAYGATIQAAILNDFNNEKIDENLDEILLIDVCPLTVGVETEGGIMTPLIERNSKIPVKRSEVFSTYEDNQTELTISVYEGERKFTKDNHFLATFDLEGLESNKPRGFHKVEVSFDIDSNGILNVFAKDLTSGSQKNITVKKETRINRVDDVKKIVNDANEHSKEDTKEAERIEARNELEALCASLLKTNIQNQEKRDIIDNTLSWIEMNPNGCKEDIDVFKLQLNNL